jgi:hypothetical protein
MSALSEKGFNARLAEFSERGAAHNRDLLRFLRSSPFGAELLRRELARQGISPAAFDRSLTLNVQAEEVPAHTS